MELVEVAWWSTLAAAGLFFRLLVLPLLELGLMILPFIKSLIEKLSTLSAEHYPLSKRAA